MKWRKPVGARCPLFKQTAGEAAGHWTPQIPGLRSPDSDTDCDVYTVQAREGSSPAGAAALERLCRAYGRPLHFFARRMGHPPEDAEDLVQGFFTKLLEKDYLRSGTPQSGRFRTSLLTAFTRFSAREWDRSQRRKRGGQCAFIPLDAGTAEDGYWFEALHPCLLGEGSDDGYSAPGTRLGLSEGGVKTVVRRMRLRFAALLREELAQSLADPADVETEMRHLLEALAS